MGGFINLGVKASHNTGKSNRRLTVIGNNGHIGRENALLSIQRCNVLAVRCGPYHNVALTVSLR